MSSLNLGTMADRNTIPLAGVSITSASSPSSSTSLTEEPIFKTGAEELLRSLEDSSSDDGDSPPPMKSLMRSLYLPPPDAGHQSSKSPPKSIDPPLVDRVSARTRSSTRASSVSNSLERTSDHRRPPGSIPSGRPQRPMRESSTGEVRNSGSPFRQSSDKDLERDADYDADSEEEAKIHKQNEYRETRSAPIAYHEYPPVSGYKRRSDKDHRLSPMQSKRQRADTDDSEDEHNTSPFRGSPVRRRSRTPGDSEADARRTLVELRKNGLPEIPVFRGQRSSSTNSDTQPMRQSPTLPPTKRPDSPPRSAALVSPRKTPNSTQYSHPNQLGTTRPSTEQPIEPTTPSEKLVPDEKETIVPRKMETVQFKKPSLPDPKILEERKRREREQREEQKENKGRKERPSVERAVPMRAVETIKSNEIVANGIRYTIINEIGYGGSSRVYKVISQKYNEVFALKRVSLANVEQHHVQAFMNEIRLLDMLKKHDRIIQMYDYEINRSMNYIYLVMELGEIDLAHLLFKQRKRPLNLNFVRMYWEQMLEAVHTIHTKKVVHTDLKPANFMLVEGAIKLIDFGIAKKIANDTTNIQREHQLGTIGYMSPEALDGGQSMGMANGKHPMKLARSSDVWSLGCILYEMVYGRTPFHDMSMWQKIKSIPDPKVEIPFPSKATFYPPTSTKRANGTHDEDEPVDVWIEEDLLDTLKSCLQRDPKKRKTIPELLQHPFLKPHPCIPIPEIKQALEHLTRRAHEVGVSQASLTEDKALQRAIQELLNRFSSMNIVPT